MRSPTRSDATGISRDEPALRTTARVIFFAALLLFILGMVMQVNLALSAGDARHLKQAFFGIVGLSAVAILSRVPYSWWKPLLIYLAPVTVILLVMVLVIGREINGSKRWLSLGPISVQPSELAKLVMIIWLAYWMSKVQRHSRQFVEGFLVPVSGLGLLTALVLVEPDFGTAILIAGVGFCIMFLAGTRLVYLVVSGVIGVLGLALVIMEDKERLSRITSFVDPQRHQSDDAYQLWEGILAFIMGGATGVGVGGSLQKNYYLPEAHTDFILAIVGEELGVAGTITVLGLFFVIFLSGMRVGWLARDAFGRWMAYGITLMITLQACINVGVVTGSLPTKGLALPFLSYGGSNLVMTWAMVGILISIARQNADIAPRDKQKVAKDSQHWV